MAKSLFSVILTVWCWVGFCLIVFFLFHFEHQKSVCKSENVGGRSISTNPHYFSSKSGEKPVLLEAVTATPGSPRFLFAHLLQITQQARVAPCIISFHFGHLHVLQITQQTRLTLCFISQEQLCCSELNFV